MHGKIRQCCGGVGISGDDLNVGMWHIGTAVSALPPRSGANVNQFAISRPADVCRSGG
jgi:hypothetical protein